MLVRLSQAGFFLEVAPNLLMFANCCAEAEKTIEGLKEKILDWQNAANRNRDEADSTKATIEDMKHKADGERKKHQDVEARLVDALEASTLVLSVIGAIC